MKWQYPLSRNVFKVSDRFKLSLNFLEVLIKWKIIRSLCHQILLVWQLFSISICLFIRVLPLMTSLILRYLLPVWFSSPYQTTSGILRALEILCKLKSGILRERAFKYFKKVKSSYITNSQFPLPLYRFLYIRSWSWSTNWQIVV